MPNIYKITVKMKAADVYKVREWRLPSCGWKCVVL